MTTELKIRGYLDSDHNLWVCTGKGTKCDDVNSKCDSCVKANPGETLRELADRIKQMDN